MPKQERKQSCLCCDITVHSNSGLYVELPSNQLKGYKRKNYVQKWLLLVPGATAAHK